MANLNAIKEGAWKFSDEGENAASVLNDKVLKRKITKLNSTEVADLVAKLRAITSLKNLPKEQCYSVVGPMVDGVEHPGLWRGVSVLDGYNGRDGYFIEQTLAFGWATQIETAETRRRVHGQPQAKTAAWCANPMST